MPFLLLGIAIYIKYYNYILNEKKLQELLNGIVSDWQTERTKEELQILHTYSERGLFFNSIYKGSICSSVIAFILLPAVPTVLDIFAPLNVSRDRLLVYPSYYFVNQEQYYYPILGHMMVCACILGCTFVACDVNLIQIVQHGCGLIAISGYRFKHAIDSVNLHEEKRNDTLSNETYKKVTRCIEAHKRADEYVKAIEACHVHYILVTAAFIVMVFTVTLIKASHHATVTLCYLIID
ncbi:uncharacterized protein LOC108627103 [Ceratina calcarata]|uniref:Uncharacterized protein LOC108627103 n=1 Tax=Ceratina calcarata TaxID=156304 RepID=A0AAJ7S4E8_9HYME|nr:uncharacterized protein LOC108627103 [Ceratina calcarata]